MRVLCVAEKPSIAKSITGILSGGRFTTRNTRTNFIKNYDFDYPQTNAHFTVTAVAGHLTSHSFHDTHQSWNSCDPFELFDAPVKSEISKEAKTMEANILAEARTADMLMIWTDCDREGEHIGSEIARVCRKAKRNIIVKRARFSAIIAQQIHNAAQHPVELDQAQADAVEARTILDLKIGAAFTRYQTKTLKALANMPGELKVISYGPCQFPTLGFVVARYNDVQGFIAEAFWYIYLALTRNEEETKFNWRRGHLFDMDVAAVIYQQVLSDVTARVTKVTKKPTKKWKPLPLTTVELQKAGSRLLRLAPKKVLDIAEKLYQQGFLSYPRTETDQFDPQFDFMTLINKQTVDPAWGQFATTLQGGEFTPPRRGKNNDKAHPPIHPTAHAGNLAGDEKRVYEFVTRRFLACCSKDAVGSQTTIDVVCGGEEFFTTGLIVHERNYLDVYPYDKWVSHAVPDFAEGEEFQPSVCELKDGETSPPNLLTEADLVTLMDKNGIGTDATIAQHIETIVQREYVIERFEGQVKYLVPSTLGIGLIEGYNQIGFDKSLSKPQLRRETERAMVQVCEKNKTKHDMLNQAIEQYKEMYIIARRDFDRVITTSTRGTKRGASTSANASSSRGGKQPTRSLYADDDEDVPPQPPVPPPPRQKPPSRAPPPLPIASSSNSGGVNCNCGTPAIRRVITNETASKGKQYWACSKDSCGFFEWTGDRVPVGSVDSDTSKTVPTKRAFSLNETNTGPARTCKCNVDGTRLTVVKEGPNQGRKFWKCAEGVCDFFEFDDEPPRTEARGFSAQNGAGGGGGGGAGKANPDDECYKVIGQAHVRMKPLVPNARAVLAPELVMRYGASNATRRAISAMLVQGNLQRHEDGRSRPPLPAEAKAHEVVEGLPEGNVAGDQVNRHSALRMAGDAFVFIAWAVCIGIVFI
ncbi:DNA topoisomerase [Pleurotus pulmonarius]|nr:DNA topoisomerase [Pleurotus pulmonarius]